jgi:hypothetical protein
MSPQALPKRISLDSATCSLGFQFDHIGAEGRVDAGAMAPKDPACAARGGGADERSRGPRARDAEPQRARDPGIGNTASTALISSTRRSASRSDRAEPAEEPARPDFAFEYSVTGSWSDPKVAKTERTGVEKATP